MIVSYLPFLAEFSIFVMLTLMIIANCFRTNTTPKTFYSISKYFLLISLLGSIVFYNKSSVDFIENNVFSTMMKSVLILSSIIWFFLSYKWFLNKNISAFRYYFTASIEIFLYIIAISCHDIKILTIIFSLLIICNYVLGRNNYSIYEDNQNAKLYLLIGFLIIAFNIFGMLILGKDGFLTNFSDVSNYLSQSSPSSIEKSFVILATILPWIFLLNLAPFQTAFINFISSAIMPVYGFLTIIPFIANLTVLINILSIFSKIETINIHPYIQFISCFSIIWGALGVSGENNIRKMFIFSNMFHIGIIILCLSYFNPDSVSAATVYSFIFTLTVLGINTAFLGCKTKGEYITDLSSLNGMASYKPYISAAFLILLFSLLGNPPLLGFIGLLSVVEDFLLHKEYYLVLFILLSLCLLAHAYLRVIKAIYFVPANNIFDRTDKRIYICLLVNLMLILFTILNPRIIVNDINIALTTIF